MERRRIIQLMAGAWATCLWTKQVSPAGWMLQASHRIGPGSPQNPRPPETLLPLFPLDLVLFPHTDLPLHIFEPRYKEMIQDCLRNDWEFGMLAVQGSLSSIGCTASISEVLERFPDGRMNIVVRGQRRFEIRQLNDEKSYLRGNTQFLEDDATEPPAEELRQRAMQLYGRLKELAKRDNQSLQEPFPVITDMQLSYRMMAGLPAELGWKQNLLELRSEGERLALVVRFLEKFIDSLEGTPDQRRTAPGKIV